MRAKPSMFILIGFVCLKTCYAQEPQVYHHLSFQEVHATNGNPVSSPNGIIEPGEGALLSLSFSFWPEVGKPMPQLPHVEIHAFATTALDIGNRFETAGTWSNLHLATGWDYEFARPGTPTTRGGVQWIQPSQAFEGADQGNPVLNVWEGMWVPASYHAQQAEFFTFPFGSTGFRTSSKLWVFDMANPQLHGRAFAWSNIDEITIPIVPSPASGSLLIAGGLFGTRRRGRIVRDLA